MAFVRVFFTEVRFELGDLRVLQVLLDRLLLHFRSEETVEIFLVEKATLLEVEVFRPLALHVGTVQSLVSHPRADLFLQAYIEPHSGFLLDSQALEAEGVLHELQKGETILRFEEQAAVTQNFMKGANLVLVRGFDAALALIHKEVLEMPIALSHNCIGYVCVSMSLAE